MQASRPLSFSCRLRSLVFGLCSTQDISVYISKKLYEADHVVFGPKIIFFDIILEGLFLWEKLFSGLST